MGDKDKGGRDGGTYKGGQGGGNATPPRDMGNTEQRDLKGSQGSENKEIRTHDR